jgi:hypothetical protein
MAATRGRRPRDGDRRRCAATPQALRRVDRIEIVVRGLGDGMEESVHRRAICRADVQADTVGLVGGEDEGVDDVVDVDEIAGLLARRRR